MPAYGRPLPNPGCLEEGCDRPAVMEVFTERSELVGAFCSPHGNRWVASRNRQLIAGQELLDRPPTV